MKKILKQLSLTLVLLFSVVGVGVPVPAHAALFDNPKAQVCEGLNAGAKNSDGTPVACDKAANKGVSGILRTALNLISLAVGVIAVIMIIVGGLKYITSQGDSNSINSAKDTLLYAVVGLVVVLLAQVIVQFVLGRTT